MKKLIALLMTAVALTGCPWGTLLDDELTGTDSVLSESLSSVAVVPPFGLKSTIKAENSSYMVLITWNSVANVKEYEVAITGDYVKTERVEVSQYKFPVSLKKGESFNAVATVKSVNVNGKVSAAGVPLAITFGSDSLYSEKVHNFYASRGDSTSVKLTYAPAKDAERYMIERRRSSVPEDDVKDVWTVLDAGVVNADETAFAYYYVDQTSEEGYRYDYRITPVDASGIAGESVVTRQGFALPLVRDLRAGQGGEGVYDGQKGVFVVEWTVQSKLLDCKYTEAGIEDVVVEDEYLTQILAQLSFEIRIASRPTQLDNFGANFDKGWEKAAGLAFFDNYNESNFSGLTVPAEFLPAEIKIGTAKVYKKSAEVLDVYRIYVIVDGTGHGTTDADSKPVERWNVKGYLQVRPVYGSKYKGLPWSNKAGGYVVDSASADLFKGTVTATADAPGSVIIAWSKDGGTATAWKLYSKKEGEAEFTEMADYGTVSDTTSMQVSGLTAGDYWFGVAAESGGIIYESDKVTVTASAAE